VEALALDKNRIIGKTIHSFVKMFPDVINIFDRAMAVKM
jgi:hypothetical protein